ncbi:MAG TPA: BadF/BadG/BcrA/BcrD ATPase family protein [Candidatus Acidoferrum sp.]|nr:BadF/BadG/BcrA/BcrD ATPase family protein [Candidatus Acidoferrum sp.]
MRFVLGFDGGGTKTECVLMDEARVVRASGRSGPSNPMRVGFGGALAAVCEAGRIAMQGADLGLPDISLVCAGLAGAAQPESEQKMKRLLREEFPGIAVHVCTDLDLTLEATGDGPAIVLIAGTGSGAVGRDPAGHIARVGAHGFLLGDEGSAFDIGRRAVIAALRASDRGQPDSPLAAKILQELGVEDWEKLHLRVYAHPDEVFPKVFPVVAAAADEGDACARELLRTAAADLAGLVKDLMERLGLDSQKFLLVKTGGMTGRSAYFDGQIDERLRAAAPGAVFGELAVSPAEAAARLALKLLRAVGKEGKQGGEN